MKSGKSGISWVACLTLVALFLVLCSFQVYADVNHVEPKVEMIAPVNATPWWDYTVTTNSWLDLGLGFDGDGRVSLWELALSAGLLVLMGSGLAARFVAWVGRIAWLGRIAEFFPRLFKVGKFFLRAEPWRLYFLGRLEEFESRNGQGLGLSRYTYGIFDKGKTLTDRIIGVGDWLIDDVMSYTTPKFIFGGLRGFLGDVYRIFAFRNLEIIAGDIIRTPSSLLAYFRAVSFSGIRSALSDVGKVWARRPKFWTNLGLDLDNLRTTVAQGRLYEFLIGSEGTRGFLSRITRIGNIAGVFNLFVLSVNQQVKYGLFPSFKNYYETYKASWRIGTLLGVGLEVASPWIEWIAQFPIVRNIAGLQVKNLYPALASEYATLTIIGDVVVEEEFRSRVDPTSVARREVGLSARKSLLAGTIDGLSFRLNVNPVFYDLIKEFGADNAEYFYSVVGGNLAFLDKGDIYAMKNLFLENGVSWENLAAFYKDSGRSLSGYGDTDLNLLAYYIKELGPDNAATFFTLGQGRLPLVTTSDLGLMRSLIDSGVTLSDVYLFYSTVSAGFENAGTMNRDVLASAIKTLGPESAALLYTSVGSNLPIKNLDIIIVKQLLNSGVKMRDIALFYKYSEISMENMSLNQILVLGKAINTIGPIDSATLYRMNGINNPIKEGDIKIIKGLLDNGVSIEAIAGVYQDSKSISSLSPSLVPIFAKAVNSIGPANAVSFFDSLGYDRTMTNADFSVVQSLISKGLNPSDVGLFSRVYHGSLTGLDTVQQQTAEYAIKNLGPNNAAQIFNGFDKGSAPTAQEVKMTGDLMKLDVSLTDISSFYANYNKTPRHVSSIPSSISVQNLAEIIKLNGPEVAGSFIGVVGPEGVINYKNYAAGLSALNSGLGSSDASEFIRYAGIDALQAYHDNPKQVSDMVHSLGAKQAGILLRRD